MTLSASPQAAGAKRVMVVDESTVLRGMLREYFARTPDIVVTGSVPQARLAVEQLERDKFDVVVVNLALPGNDSQQMLEDILLAVPPECGVIAMATLTEDRGGLSMRAISQGAADFILKPSQEASREEKETFHHALHQKIRDITGLDTLSVPMAPKAEIKASTPAPTSVSAPTVSLDTFSYPPKIPIALAIGSSTGGPQALSAVVQDLRGTLKNVPIFLTQHMPPKFTASLAEQLKIAGDRPCMEAENGMIVKPGEMYVAPGNYHMTVVSEGVKHTLRLSQDAPENFCRPAVDYMLRGLAPVYGDRLLTVILTGMGQDGMLGAEVMRKAGGFVVAQDQATSVVWGMPKAVVNAGHANAVLPLSSIGAYIRKSFGGGA